MNSNEQSDRGVSDAGLAVVAGVLGSAGAVALFGAGTAGAIVGGIAPPALVFGAKAYSWAVGRREERAGRYYSGTSS